MSEVWNTKYGPRRVRFDPPVLREAIFAAQGLTDDLAQQAEIAAALMDLPLEAVRAELMRLAPPRNSAKIVTSGGREGASRTVIVERKQSRRAQPAMEALRPGAPKRPIPSQAAKENRKDKTAPLSLAPRGREPWPP